MSDTTPTDKTDQPTARAVIPLVAILGRPNVGKSTIFNRLVGQRRSIVSDEAGVTRDRIYGTLDWSGVNFEVVDTGGIIPGEESEIPQKIFEQAQVAIDASALLIMVVDARSGLTGADQALAQLLRATGRTVFLAVNKVDSEKQESDVGEFMRLGFEHVYPVSAEHGRGFSDLLDELARTLPPSTEAESGTRDVRVAIIGRPNAGKSTLLNSMLGEDRSMVSSIAGTTRDAVDSFVERDGVRFRLVDTAGIRHRGRKNQKAERLSIVMAKKHLERSDVAILLIDADEFVTGIDATIGGYAHEAGRSVIIAVNKWDLIDKGPATTADFEKRIREKLKFLEYAPIIFISAKTKQRVHKLFAMAAEIFEVRGLRIGTGELNKFIKEINVHRGGLPSEVRVKYISQVRVAPPTFVVFTSTARKFHFSFERFLSNRIRERFSFMGTPIIIKQRSRNPTKRGGNG